MRDPLDPLAGLPDRFEYIRDVTTKYTRPRRDHERKWQASVDSLSATQLNEIASVYRAMATRGDAAPLSAWIDLRKPEVRQEWNKWWEARIEAEKKGLPRPPEPEQEPRALRLFELFEYLEKKGIAPFDSGEIKCDPSRIKLDWSKLPRELNYLLQAAEEHGVLWGDDAWAQQAAIIKDRMPDVFGELEQINRRLYGTPGEWQRIDSFLSAYPIDVHPEAARVRSLLILLDHLFGRR